MGADAEHYAEVLDTPAFLGCSGFGRHGRGHRGARDGPRLPDRVLPDLPRGTARAALPDLLLLPFAVSYLLRVMAWKVMLGPEGGINSLLARSA